MSFNRTTKKIKFYRSGLLKKYYLKKITKKVPKNRFKIKLRFEYAKKINKNANSINGRKSSIYF